MNTASLPRRALAEFIGTMLLVAIVVGSGIMAARLSPDDIGLELLENSTTTAFGLAIIIVIFGPVSGAHFNPVVSVADWLLGRPARDGIAGRDLAAYLPAQVAGGITGAVLANLMFGLSAVSISTKDRSAPHLWIGEVVATAGLILLIFALVRSGRLQIVPGAVGAYIGAAYWFTSSTSFANPAVTIGRIFSKTFAGIAPGSVAGFIGAQVAGLIAGVVLVAIFYPRLAQPARDTAAAVADGAVAHGAVADGAAAADGELIHP